jgi:hypothetical protein
VVSKKSRSLSWSTQYYDFRTEISKYSVRSVISLTDHGEGSSMKRSHISTTGVNSHFTRSSFFIDPVDVMPMWLSEIIQSLTLSGDEIQRRARSSAIHLLGIWDKLRPNKCGSSKIPCTPTMTPNTSGHQAGMEIVGLLFPCGAHDGPLLLAS